MVTSEVRAFAHLAKKRGLSRLRAERALMQRFPTLEKCEASEALGDLHLPGLWSETGLYVETTCTEYDPWNRVDILEGGPD